MYRQWKRNTSRKEKKSESHRLVTFAWKASLEAKTIKSVDIKIVAENIFAQLKIQLQMKIVLIKFWNGISKYVLFYTTSSH